MLDFFQSKTHTLIIFMKSGNKFLVDHVTEYEFRTTGDKVTYFKLSQSPKARHELLVGVIDLHQIEAVVKVK